MARVGLLDVRRHEWRPRARWQALRLHIQPQLRRPAGQGQPHAPRLPRHGGGRGAHRAHHGREEAVMEPFRVLEGIAAPIDQSKVDTDQILPARFLRRPRKEGYGSFLFRDLMDNPDFVLNQSAYRQAKILVADRNFGGGSSREQAPWALSDYGIRCVIAVDFGDIFYLNSLKSSVLPIALDFETCF